MSARSAIDRPDALFRPVKNADDPRLADAAVHLDPQLTHPLGHQRRRAVLLEADLGIRVQISPQRGESFVMRKNRSQRSAQCQS